MNQSATGLTMLAGQINNMSIATSMQRGRDNNSVFDRRLTETVNFGRGNDAMEPINFGLKDNGANPVGDSSGLRGPLD